jgi:hypothetical protein
MADQFTNKIVVVIDKSIMEEYRKIYFKMNPRCKVFPKYFENPIPPSWNFFIAKIRMQQADIKSKYGDFGMWLAAHYKLAGLNLDKAVFTYDFYFDSNRKRDIDNYGLTNKLLADGFVKANVLVDDNSNHLALRFNPFQLDRQNPRVEITIEY